MNRCNRKKHKPGYIERLWIMLLLMLGLADVEKRIGARAAAAKKADETALISTGAVVGLAGIVFAVRLKRKIWPHFPKAVSTPKEKD